MTSCADAGLLTILIPAYNRPDDLQTTLSKLRSSGISTAYRTVVIDDGSSSSAVGLVARSFSEVEYIRLDKNVGLIAARNAAAQLVSTPFYMNLDDDSWPETREGVEAALELLSSDSKIGVVALNVRTKSALRWREGSGSKLVRTYVGCGNIYRTEAARRAGEYVAEFRRQGEEIERCMRMYDAGYEVRSLPSSVVFHNESPINRNVVANRTREAANYLRRELLRTPLPFIWLGLARWVIYTALRSGSIDLRMLHRELVGAGSWNLRAVLRRRRAVKPAAYIKFMLVANW